MTIATPLELIALIEQSPISRIEIDLDDEARTLLLVYSVNVPLHLEDVYDATFRETHPNGCLLEGRWFQQQDSDAESATSRLHAWSLMHVVYDKKAAKARMPIELGIGRLVNL